ncbi:hypothetical protein [Falsirhodobacter sp. 1013]|uniref:hypothetical protein n=1 Tax=Falsirhodobacter sp. 1013 TaxID=3417566 RepID=UPI003EC081F1
MPERQLPPHGSSTYSALATALAYLVNAQHDLRTGSDPARTLATLSEGVAAVEAGISGGGA